MADCVLERIAKAILDALDTVEVDGVRSAGDPPAQRPARAGLPEAPRHGSIVLYQDDPREDEAPAGYKAWIQPFVVDCYVHPPDGDENAIDTQINNFRAAVEKKLREDPTWGGLAQDTRIRPAQAFVTTENVDGVRVVADVHYRTLEDDPFAVS